jgi:hypothetical protein
MIGIFQLLSRLAGNRVIPLLCSLSLLIVADLGIVFKTLCAVRYYVEPRQDEKGKIPPTLFDIKHTMRENCISQTPVQIPCRDNKPRICPIRILGFQAFRALQHSKNLGLDFFFGPVCPLHVFDRDARLFHCFHPASAIDGGGARQARTGFARVFRRKRNSVLMQRADFFADKFFYSTFFCFYLVPYIPLCNVSVRETTVAAIP